MLHPISLKIGGLSLSCLRSVIQNKVKYIAHATIGTIKKMIDIKTQKKFQRHATKGRAFKEYAQSILNDFENIPIYGCLINKSTFVIVDGQTRLMHIFSEARHNSLELELIIYEVATWPEAADMFYKLNNATPQSSSIILHNSYVTGPFLRQCGKTMVSSNYINAYRPEGRDGEDRIIDCQDIALLVKASMTGDSRGALHAWIRTHKHEVTQEHITNLSSWLDNTTAKLQSIVKANSAFDRTVQVALARIYHCSDDRELCALNINNDMSELNYKNFRKHLKNYAGRDMVANTMEFLIDATHRFAEK